jgi:hypothetical protein
MIGVRRTGATAAAVLPAALAGAILVSAPFAGTTTAPLAKSTTRAAVTTTGHPAASRSAGGGNDGLRFEISPRSVAMLGGAEMVLLGVGAGVIVAARRRRYADD